ncbi:flagellar biosynthesis protein FlhF [Sphaerotilus uruguayifluvii]|uniref:Flagellar biosynthesis protein FlhF n=1 Tax=Sphaerotilus uruguayifluvii TaxID=2735897 RepID=A0ABX2FZ12_9BURK|nr:flagellar biosynthesis protein FlhF [Leptothrix sp. C29]NRT55245.1 flagellar biosynthesis protein FlhF [Leptothrix sp. C29]
MNVKRFFGRNSREAMQKVRQAFGDNAVVLSTKPSSSGIEIVAMPAESIDAIERFESAPAGLADTGFDEPMHESAAPEEIDIGATDAGDQVQEDVGTLAMSTLSFQDYVRERMLKKRQAELKAQQNPGDEVEPEPVRAPQPRPATPARAGEPARREAAAPSRAAAEAPAPAAAPSAPGLPATYADWMRQQELRDREEALPAVGQRPYPPVMSLHDDEQLSTSDGDLYDTSRMPRLDMPEPGEMAPARMAAAPRGVDPGDSILPSSTEMLNEIRAMKGMIEERFNTMAFMDRLHNSPRHSQLTMRLLDAGFSPGLIRKLCDSLGDDVTDEMVWAADVLQRNVLTGENEPDIEDQGGVYAMIGSTGVGKTTSTAKLATSFATRHGAANLGLITLDAYRVGAHEQLRAYGRILGVPVHTAHDRAALEDLLDLLSGKRMVLIDTAGLAQRDARTRDLLDMLSHRSIKRLLVVNAAQQGETIEDVLSAYSASQARGIILSKLDEAVKLGPALDALIRQHLKVLAVSNGQRVPEDWHRLSAQSLVTRALRSGGPQAWRLNTGDVDLIFSRPNAPAPVQGAAQPVAAMPAAPVQAAAPRRGAAAGSRELGA